MAIDRALPFHLNTFGNSGFGAGTHTTSSSMSIGFNYTAKMAANVYKTFNATFTNYKVLFFLTCFDYYGQV